MKKILNESGSEIVLIKSKIINNEIPKEIIPIVISKYPTKVQELLNNNSLTLINFTDNLKSFQEYCLTNEEMILKNDEDIKDLYDNELSKTNEKFTIKVEKNRLYIYKYFRISKTYYNKFMGVPLHDLHMKAIDAKKNDPFRYRYEDKITAEEKRYNEELKNYNTFVKRRISIVLTQLKDNIYNTKLIPLYKSKKFVHEKPIYVSTGIEDNVGTIYISINLNDKDEFNKNIKLINKFLSDVEGDIELYMNYDLYK